MTLYWWGCDVAAEFAEEVAQEEASSAVQEGDASADVDAGRVAAPCTPWTVNPALMMLESRVSTREEVADTARRLIVMRSRTSRRMVLNWGAVVEMVEDVRVAGMGELPWHLGRHHHCPHPSGQTATC